MVLRFFVIGVLASFFYGENLKAMEGDDTPRTPVQTRSKRKAEDLPGTPPPLKSPYSALKDTISPIRRELSRLLVERGGSLSPRSIEGVWMDLAPDFFDGDEDMWADPKLFAANSNTRLEKGLNPVCYNGMRMEAHHPWQMDSKLIFLPRDIHRSTNDDVLVEILPNGQTQVVKSRLTRDEAIALQQKMENQKPTSKFKRVDNGLHARREGASLVHRGKAGVQRRQALRRLAGNNQ